MLLRIYRFLRWNTPLASLFRYRGVWPPEQASVGFEPTRLYPTEASFAELNRARLELDPSWEDVRAISVVPHTYEPED